MCVRELYFFCGLDLLFSNAIKLEKTKKQDVLSEEGTPNTCKAKFSAGLDSRACSISYSVFDWNLAKVCVSVVFYLIQTVGSILKEQ